MEIRNVLQAKQEQPEFRDDMDIASVPVQTGGESGEKERRTSVVKPVTQHRGLGECG